MLGRQPDKLEKKSILAKNTDYQPATGYGRFGVKLEGQELKVKMKIFIDSSLAATDLVKFTNQAEPIIKQYWENQYGFKCTNAAYPHTYKPSFTIKYATGANDAHWVMTMTETVNESISNKPWWKSEDLGLANKPNSAKMRPTSASDVNTLKAHLPGQILKALRNAFPFYADVQGTVLSIHAQSELKLLAKEIKKLDPSATLTVTTYGNNKSVIQDSTISLLKGYGLNNVLKRRSKKILKARSPKTGSANYIKILLKNGLGQADPSTVGLFHYPATIVHEFGHMLGLVDEYNCLSNDAADKMADLHFIHPSERNLFQGYSDDAREASPEAKAGQAVLAEYCDEAGVQPAQYGNRTISIMSAGSKFYPRHYVTLWKAITELTQASTQPSEWSIVKL